MTNISPVLPSSIQAAFKAGLTTDIKEGQVSDKDLTQFFTWLDGLIKQGSDLKEVVSLLPEDIRGRFIAFRIDVTTHHHFE